MSRFFVGDELGAIKSVKYSKDPEGKQWNAESSVLCGDASAGRAKAVQKLALRTGEGEDPLLAALRADGSASILRCDPVQSTASESSHWRENRLKEGQRFVGSAFSHTGVYSCTSNGALRLTKPGADEAAASHQLAALPMRLTEWRLGSDEATFAYAGDEVELSVWDTERAFSEGVRTQPNAADHGESQSKKRKRSEQLLPGEIWRAKNLPNDTLNLRQPVRNTALAFLQPSESASQQHLLVGTQLGDVRRYDTRAARRPVANFTGVAKVGGIGSVENGTHEHQVFVADHGSNLFALDLRNGKVSYGYKGLAGAVNSMAPCPSYLASTSEDRFLRLHSTYAPPVEVGAQQEHKGDVLDKLYMKVKPTVVIWDGQVDVDVKTGNAGQNEAESDDEGDDVWDKLEDIDSDDEAEGRKKSRQR